MALTLVQIGTQYFWRDSETREYTALHNPFRSLSFTTVDEMGMPVSPTTPDPMATTVSLQSSPGYCPDCRQAFEGPCHCQNLPKPNQSKPRQRV